MQTNQKIRTLGYCFLQLITLGLFAQSPSLINYQGAARLADGTPLDNRTISIKFDLREGSSSGSIVATETQTVQTNQLGLFTTQIGKNTNISAINWQSNTMFLQVGIDTSAGAGFTDLGVQQMISVPYAMHANTVPSSYTNNILTIGTNTYAMSPTVAVVPTTSITLSGIGTITSVGTNTFDINIPAPTFTGQGETTVSGTFPTYTISSTTPSISVTSTAAAGPSVTSTGSSFSINLPPPTFTNSGQNIISGTYPNFTVNTPTVAAAPNTTLTPLGLVTVLNPATNSFVVGVQTPTFTNAGQNIITGNYPNYTVTTPTVPTPSLVVTSTAAAGPSVTSTGPSFSLNIPPAITPSITVSATAAAGPSVSSTGSSFSINIPPPSFTNTGQTIIVGSYPNFSVNTPTVGATPLTTVSPSGLVTVSNPATNSFVVDVQTPVFTNMGQNIITGTYPNFSVNTPTTVAPPTVAGSGLATVSGAPNYVVDVQAPVFTNTGQNIITGTYPNFSVNTPTNPAPPTVSGAGIVTVTGAPNYLVDVQAPIFTNTGQNIITGTHPNYSVNTPTVPGTSIAVTSTAAAGPSVSVIGTNSFNINIPPSNAWSFLGNAGTNTVTNFIGTTDATDLNFRTNNVRSGRIDIAGNSAYFGFNAGPATGVGSGNTGIGYHALNTVTTGGDGNTAIGYLASLSNSTGFFNTAVGGASQMGNTTGNNNTSLGYQALRNNVTGGNNVAIGSSALGANTGATGGNAIVGASAGVSNTSGSNNTMLGTQTGNSNLTGSGNVFLGYQAGYNELGSNKLYIANNNVGTPLIYGDFSTGNVGLATTAPLARLDVAGAGTTAVSVVKVTNINAANTNAAFDIATNGTGYGVLATQSNAGLNAYAGMFDGGVLTKGKNALSTAYALRSISSASTDLFVVRNDGLVGIGGNTPVHANTSLLVSRPGAADNHVVITGGDNSNGFGGILSLAENLNQAQGMSFKLDAGSNRLVLTTDVAGSNGSAVVGFGGYSGTPAGVAIGAGFAFNNAPTNGLIVQGNTGIGTNAPTAALHVAGASRFVDGTQAAGRIMTSDASGNASWVASPDWSRAGNAGTNPASEFIGTTDAQAFRIRTNNLERVAVTSAGHIGIGLTTPLALVHIDNQLVTTRDALNIVNGRDMVGSAMPAYIGASTAGQIFGTNTFGRIMRLENTTLGAFVDIGMDQNSAFFISKSGSYNPNADFVISNTGNVGIGTSSPNALLQFDNSIANRKIVLWEGANNDHQYYGFGINGGTLRYQVDATAADHVFFAGTGVATSNELMRIKGNGNVGIGTNNPIAKLEFATGIRNIATGDGQSTFYAYGGSVGGAIKAESNGTGLAGSGTIYSQAVLAGIHTNGPAGNLNYGVWGNATGQGSDGYGVVASHGVLGAADKYAALAGPSLAGFFSGNVQVTGLMAKGGGSFKIDHPQDPANKYLYHSFVESPDMMNVYNGNITTDGNGDALVQLPNYFEALNVDFRYQLTVMGQFAQAIVSEEVVNNQFKIKTDKPNVKVSWQVTGVRNDEFAKANRIVPEVDKETWQKGKYLHPELFGQGREMRLQPDKPDSGNGEQVKQ